MYQTAYIMNKSLVFLMLTGFILSACQPTFPDISPPQRLLSHISVPGGGKVSTFFYQQNLLDSMHVLEPVEAKFKIRYVEDQVDWVRETSRWEPTGEEINIMHNYSYQSDQIVIRSMVETAQEGIYNYTRTYAFDESGERANEYRYRVVQTAPTGGENIIRDDLRAFMWDEDGENILEEKFYQINRQSTTGERDLIGTATYTYDDKPNPYFGMTRPFFLGSAEAPAFFSETVAAFNENNVLSYRFIYDDAARDDISITRSYTYGDKEFIDTETRSGFNTGAGIVLLYRYEE